MMDVSCTNAAAAAYGVSLRLEATPRQLREALRARASALGWKDVERAHVDLDYAAAASAGGFELRCNGETVRSTSDSRALVDAFEDHSKIELALRSPDYVFVHAGVVGWRGGAIVVPGRSRTGKTTLVEALVRAGAEYYSDEFAVLEAGGQVHPYAIPLAIRSPGGRTAVTVEAIGGRTGTMPLPVALVVLTEYHPRGRWRPRTVSPALGMLGLMENTVAARQSPDRTMPTLRRVAEGAAIVRSRRGCADDMARILLAETA
jgi:hypothetical protein